MTFESPLYTPGSRATFLHIRILLFFWCLSWSVSRIIGNGLIQLLPQLCTQHLNIEPPNLSLLGSCLISHRLGSTPYGCCTRCNVINLPLGLPSASFLLMMMSDRVKVSLTHSHSRSPSSHHPYHFLVSDPVFFICVRVDPCYIHVHVVLLEDHHNVKI